MNEIINTAPEGKIVQIKIKNKENYFVVSKDREEYFLPQFVDEIKKIKKEEIYYYQCIKNNTVVREIEDSLENNIIAFY